MLNRNKKIALQCVFFLLMVNASVLFGAYSPNIERNDAVDRVLRRFDARYSCLEDLLIQPYKYAPIRNYLLSGIDTTKLSAGELIKRKQLLTFLDPAHGLIKWNSEQKDVHLRVHLSLLGDVNGLIDNDGHTVGMKGIIHPMLTGNLGKLSFFSGIDVWTEYRSDTMFSQPTYQPYNGLSYNLYGRNTDSARIRASDVPRGGVCYDAGVVKLEAAIDYLKTGPAVFYPLTLSGTAPPITYAKGDLDLGVITYSHVAGILRSQKDKAKYIYYHRLGAPLFNKKLMLGINEVIINGSSIDQKLGDSNRVSEDNYKTNSQRSWELVYLIPFVPFKFVEHYVGDRDNAAISLDLTLRYPQGFRWYGEFFLDDMLAPWKVFTNDWGNKWALTCGMQYYGAIKNRDMEIDVEYSHVEPWVYTHFFGGSHRYTNFDKCLGSPLGPNSQALIAQMQIAVNSLLNLGAGVSYTAKNSSVRGGNITDIFQYPDEKDSTRFKDQPTKHFLGKGTVSEFGPLVTAEFNQFGIFKVLLKCQLDLVDHPGRSNVMLNGGFVF